MVWTAVPEAAVNEHYQLVLWKCKVRSPEDGAVASPICNFVVQPFDRAAGYLASGLEPIEQ
jgi:hypothetical protein